MKNFLIKSACVVAGLFFFITSSIAQSEEEAVKTAIMTLFDGMREADSAKVHSVFIDDVSMQTIAPGRNNEMMLQTGDLQRFLTSVGTPHDRVYDERILDYQIKIDGAVASVWTPYKFYLGDQFSHCGVNSFQLMKGTEGWKIIYLVDTRRRGNCE